MQAALRGCHLEAAIALLPACFIHAVGATVNDGLAVYDMAQREWAHLRHTDELAARHHQQLAQVSV